MKYTPILAVLAVCSLLIASCSKDKTGDSPIDRTESLKNTTWAGEFQYTTGEFTDAQPFSVTLAADGTLTWSDVGSTRPAGTWAVNRDTLSITFPNSTVISATITDESWSGFKGGTAAGVLLTHVEKSAIIDPAKLTGSGWMGIMGGSVLEITFPANQKINYTLGGSAGQNLPYTIEGAGIRFNYTGFASSSMNYAIFTNNTTTMKGVERHISGIPSNTIYYQYTNTKQ
ncbi:MAG: hypothetical protein EOO05_13380 [Chitinophagaceae bacterium]|nr:MAG: hypothetical protein EOO05_13380 [Chitinophagaceae bacterium]